MREQEGNGDKLTQRGRFWDNNTGKCHERAFITPERVVSSI
jgi:hypothetical protein